MFIGVLAKSLLSPSGAAYSRSYVAPDGACEFFSYRSYIHSAPLELARCPSSVLSFSEVLLCLIGRNTFVSICLH
jgi:hypothetical protein